MFTHPRSIQNPDSGPNRIEQSLLDFQNLSLYSISTKNTFFSLKMFPVTHTLQYLKNTILDKNVKKNTPGMFHFRILHSKDPYTQDTFPSPPKKNNVEGSPEHFWSRLNNTDQGGVGGGATMMLNSLGVSPVHNKV